MACSDSSVVSADCVVQHPLASPYVEAAPVRAADAAKGVEAGKRAEFARFADAAQ